MARIDWRLRLVLALALLSAAAPAARARGADDLLGGSGSAGDGDLQVTASFSKPDGNQPAELTITADIPDGWHIYSLTQKSGGPLRSRIKFQPPLVKTGDALANADFVLKADFTASPPPLVHTDPIAYGNLPLEEHHGRVTWKAPIEFKPGVDPAKLAIHGAVNAQRCSDSCLAPKDFPFVATLVGADKSGAGHAPPAAEPAGPQKPAAGNGSGVYKAEGSHVVIHGSLSPAVVAPGGTAQLVISAEPETGWHIYALAPSAPVTGSRPTLIALSDSSHLRYTLPAPSAKPREVPDPGEGTLRYYEAPVTWTIFFEVPATAAPGEYPISGLLGYQTCSDTNCDFPQGASFLGNLRVGSQETPGNIPLDFQASKYALAAQAAEQVAKANPEMAGAGATPHNADNTAQVAAAPPKNAIAPKQDQIALPAALLFSFLGGFILNFMPCVLPVIGLKLLSFLEQGGKSRGHVFALNLCYTGGILAVFMVLATLAAFAGFAWGERSTSFNIGLTCVVFVMALSFLGVWEIPIPGFVGSGKGVELAAKEGAVGAFSKGVLTTVLATPCSGPFLGAVFAYLLKQPPQIVYLIFATIGIGMSLPYLVIGAFPQLIRFLPKPGVWMDTFKQFMGFVLLGTVVYLFWTLNRTYLVPTFALLIGLWAGCWWIGRTPLFAPLSRKLSGWVAGGAVATAVGIFAFNFLTPTVLDWPPFTQPRLDKLTSEGKAVLVDFTASWCPTCQVNLRYVIDSEEVRDAIKANNVNPMIADWSDYGAEIKTALNKLTNSDSLPVLVVFPAGRPDEPIVLRDLLSKGEVIDALRKAGPLSKGAGAPANAQAEQTTPATAALR